MGWLGFTAVFLPPRLPPPHPGRAITPTGCRHIIALALCPSLWTFTFQHLHTLIFYCAFKGIRSNLAQSGKGAV